MQKKGRRGHWTGFTESLREGPFLSEDKHAKLKDVHDPVQTPFGLYWLQRELAFCWSMLPCPFCLSKPGEADKMGVVSRKVS